MHDFDERLAQRFLGDARHHRVLAVLGEQRQHAQNLSTMDQSLPDKRDDPLLALPPRSNDPLGIWGQIGHFNGLTRLGDVPDLADTDGDAPKCAVEPLPRPGGLEKRAV